MPDIHFPIPTTEHLIRPDIAALAPPEQPESVAVLAARLGISPQQIVRLDANENPYGPAAGVVAALARFDGYHRYPDPQQRELRDLCARYSGYYRDRIIVGNGVDELIDLLLRVFVSPDDEVITCAPTTGRYGFAAAVAGGRAVAVPRRSSFGLDVEAVLQAITPRSKLIFVASPNDPTGNVIGSNDVVRLLRMGVIVVVDETYYEFADSTVAPLVREFNNLIVLRSFGAWAGLAGLGVAYGIFPHEVWAQAMKVRPPHNVGVAATVALRATLADLASVQHNVRLIRLERGRLYRQLRKLNFLQPYPSQGNFLLCRVLLGTAPQLQRSLERHGIFVRGFAELPDHLRISVGSPAQSERLLHALLRSRPY